jgi:aspartate kinase
MTGQPGIMARIVNTLNEVGIKIYQTTDSHTVISCLIKEEDKIKALNALHDAFNLNTIGG